MKRVVLSALAVLALGGVAAADELRVSGDGVRTVPVQYADLNLDAREDAASMFSRLRYATLRACESSELVANPNATERREARQCRQAALQQAVAELDAPEVTRLFAAQTR